MSISCRNNKVFGKQQNLVWLHKKWAENLK